MTRDWARYTLPAVALLILFAVVNKCQTDRWERERSELLQQADSVRARTRADSAAAAAQLAAVTDSLRRVAAVARDSALTASRTADALRAERARLLAAAAPVATARPDSEVVVLRQALALADSETVALRTALAQTRLEVRTTTAEMMAARAALTVAQRSGAELRQVNTDLRRMLARAEAPCRLLWWSCPSRRATMAGTAAVVVAVMMAAGQ